MVTGLILQYSMDHDQYPRTIIAATDILANHRHDNFKKKGPWKEKEEKQSSENTEEKSTETSFAQSKSSIICYCCAL